jgi:hypothetical protein
LIVYLQGPTVSPVFCKRDGKVSADYYAIVICVPKKALYKSIQQLRAVSFLTNVKAVEFGFSFKQEKIVVRLWGQLRKKIRKLRLNWCLKGKNAEKPVVYVIP